MSATITYQPISQDDSQVYKDNQPVPNLRRRSDLRIYEDGKAVGTLSRREDVFNPGSFSFYVHISEDRRGAHPVPSGCTIDATVNLALDTHPLFS